MRSSTRRSFPSRPMASPSPNPTPPPVNAHSIGICYEGSLDERGRAADTPYPSPKGRPHRPAPFPEDRLSKCRDRRPLRTAEAANANRTRSFLAESRRQSTKSTRGCPQGLSLFRCQHLPRLLQQLKTLAYVFIIAPSLARRPTR